jgi:hypothetical protein
MIKLQRDATAARRAIRDLSAAAEGFGFRKSRP